MSAAAARISAAVSYLRLLSSMVTRAPNPEEAAARASLLLAALVKAIRAQSRALGETRDADPALGSSTRSPERSGTDTSAAGGCAGTSGDGSGDGDRVRTRSTASDSVVLCMQALRFLLDWAESSVGGVVGNGSGSGSSTRILAEAVASSPNAGAMSAEGSPATSGSAVGATNAERSSAGGVSDRNTRKGAGYGEAPTCLHGLKARLSLGRGNSGTGAGAGASAGSSGSLSGSSTVCFVCPLVDKGRRCEFVQVVVQTVREIGS